MDDQETALVIQFAPGNDRGWLFVCGDTLDQFTSRFLRSQGIPTNQKSLIEIPESESLR